MTTINDTHSSIDAEHNFVFGDEPYLIEVRVIRCGNDYVFVFGGGSVYHIGAIAVCLYHPSLKNHDHYTTTPSVITIPGHKEDMLARSAALQLSRELKTNVTICVGLHVDQASKSDIQRLERNFQVLLHITIRECKKIFYKQP
jgi:hypothetical protein